MLHNRNLALFVVLVAILILGGVGQFCDSPFDGDPKDLQTIVNYSFSGCENVTIFMKSGTYLFSELQHFQRNLTLIGEDITIFDLSGIVSNAMIFLANPDIFVTRYTFEGITFQKSNYGPVMWATQSGVEVHVRNCTFLNLNLQKFDDLYPSKRQAVIVLEGQGPDNSGTVCSFENNNFVDISNGDGIVLEGLCTNSQIVGNVFSGMTTPQTSEVSDHLIPQDRFSAIRVANFFLTRIQKTKIDNSNQVDFGILVFDQNKTFTGGSCLISANIIDGPRVSGIFSSNVRNLRVSQNQIMKTGIESTNSTNPHEYGAIMVNDIFGDKYLIDSNRIRLNGNGMSQRNISGIWLNVTGDGLTPSNSQIRSNCIFENQFGLILRRPDTVIPENDTFTVGPNWWGSGDGPKPIGKGNAVVPSEVVQINELLTTAPSGCEPTLLVSVHSSGSNISVGSGAFIQVGCTLPGCPFSGSKFQVDLFNSEPLTQIHPPLSTHLELNNQLAWAFNETGSFILRATVSNGPFMNMEWWSTSFYVEPPDEESSSNSQSGNSISFSSGHSDFNSQNSQVNDNTVVLVVISTVFGILLIVFCLAILIVLIIVVLISFTFFSRRKNDTDLELKATSGPLSASLKLDDELLVIPFEEITITQRISSGAFGTVYMGKYGTDQVAVKVIHNIGEDNIQDFINELNTLRKLKHPNVLLLLGACVKAPRYALVTEFCQNGSLHGILHKKTESTPKLDWLKKLDILEDIACGMSYIHRKGLIHRDLKSANILMTSSLQAKIGDLGLAKAMTSDHNTQNIGTALWMAPEVIRGGKYDGGADIYSVGMIIYELLFEKLPFYDQEEQSRIPFLVASRSDFRPTIPPEILQKESETPRFMVEKLLSLMKRAWDSDPSVRPPFEVIHREIRILKTQ